ncbi:hypothetical protein [Coleofasciculus sp. H7-2]
MSDRREWMKSTDSRLPFLETFKTIDRDIPWVFYNGMGCSI